MTTKWSALSPGTAPAGTDQVVGLQLGSNVRWTMAQLQTQFGIGKYAANIGDGSAVSYVVTHNLNTLDVSVTLYRNATPNDEVICDIQHTSVNTITLIFSTAPATNQFRVVVRG